MKERKALLFSKLRLENSLHIPLIHLLLIGYKISENCQMADKKDKIFSLWGRASPKVVEFDKYTSIWVE